MKKMIFVILLLLCVGNGMPLMGKCQTCSRNRQNKANVIDDYPYVITKSGRYKFENDLILHRKDINDAAIIIKADNVTLDMDGHSLDMNYSGRAGIVVGAFKNIRIYNGKILHTGHPGKIPSSAVPFATEPLRGIGLALRPGGENIYIEDMTFEENYIGIGSLDKVNLLSIRNCEGIACGLKINSKLRGGFIVIAPTQASEQNFENIKISYCTASSETAQYGIAVFNAKNLFVENCTIHHPINGGAITASESHNINFKNLTAHGGSDCISTINCTDAKITNCSSLE